MNSTAARNSAAARDWAARKKEAMDRAAQLREERKTAGSGGPPPPAPRSSSVTANTRRGGTAANGGGEEPPPANRRPIAPAEASSAGGQPLGHLRHHSFGQHVMKMDPADALHHMPAIDLRPVRVRRPPSSSRIHSQGQVRESLAETDDWSSPVKPSPPRDVTSASPVGGEALPAQPRRGSYDAASYQSAAADAPRARRSSASHDSPRHGRRAVRPGWNSDFTEAGSLQQSEDDTDPQTSAAAQVHAPRSGRRSLSGSKAPPEDSYLHSVESRAQQQRQTEAPAGAVRTAQGNGLAKLKQMSLKRVGSVPPGSSTSRSSSASAAEGGSAAAWRRGEMSPKAAPIGSWEPASAAAGTSQGLEDEFAGEPVELRECGSCGRRFNEAALARHERVCAKVFQEKRKPMDMTKQRVAGTEAAKHYRAPRGEGARPSAIKQAAMERRAAADVTRAEPPWQPPEADYNPSAYEESRDPWAAADVQADVQPRARPSSSQRRSRGHREPPPVNSPWPPPGSDVAHGDAAPPADELVQCGSCGRRFNPESLAKHTKICAKVFQTKRKPLDMTKQRVQGTEAASFVAKAKGGGGARGGRGAAPSPAPRPVRSQDRPIRSKESGKPKWKQQSEGLRAAMAAQRQIQQVQAAGGSVRDIPYVPSGPDPSFIQCPHCGRSFNETAAERHIPRCKDILAKPTFLSRGSGRGAYSRSGGAAGVARPAVTASRPTRGGRR